MIYFKNYSKLKNNISTEKTCRNFIQRILVFPFLFLALQSYSQDFFEDLISLSFYIEHPQVADFNEDGYDDILGTFTQINGAGILINNQSDPVSFMPDNLSGDLVLIGSPGIGDMDQDGDLDIVYADGSIDGIIQYYLFTNDGDANFTKSLLDISEGFATYISLLDVDGDQDMDIIGHDPWQWNNQELFVNTGNLEFERTLIYEGYPNNKSLRIRVENASDIDQDGDIDFILANYDANTEEDHLFIMINNGANSFEELTISSGFHNIMDVNVEDINEDGKLDVIAINKSQCTAWLQQGTLEFMQNSLITNISEYDFSRLLLTDYNNDGTIDILISDNEQRLRWYQNTDEEALTFGSSRFVGDVQPDNVPIGAGGPNYNVGIFNGDFNNDNKIDIVASGSVFDPVEFVDHFGFRWYINQIEDATTSISDLNSNKWNVFPNPFQSGLNVQNLSSHGNYRVTISTITGQIIYSEILKDEVLELSSIPNGVYFLSLTDENKQESKTIKLIKAN